MAVWDAGFHGGERRRSVGWSDNRIASLRQPRTCLPPPRLPYHGLPPDGTVEGASRASRAAAAAPDGAHVAAGPRGAPARDRRVGGRALADGRATAGGAAGRRPGGVLVAAGQRRGARRGR